MAAEPTQVSRFGSNPAKALGTQTLPLQTQLPTQLMSHEVHQFTQLLDPDSVEHLHADTLPSSSALEGPGSTLLVHNDDTPHFRNAGGSLHDTNATAVQSDPHGRPHLPEDHGTINTTRDYVASDATTEEGDIDDIGYLDSDAESRRTGLETDVAEAICIGGREKPVGIAECDLPGVGDGPADSQAVQNTPEAEVVVSVTEMKPSQLEPTNIASSTVPLNAPGQLAADQSVSLGLARKDGVKLDSNATFELFPCVSNGDPRKLFEASDVDLCPTTGLHAEKAAGSDASEPGKNDQVDFNATLELDNNAIENLPLIQGMSKTDINQTESHDRDGVINDTGLGANGMEDRSNAVSEALETACANALEKPIQPQEGKQLHSSPSGLRRASTSLSYMKSQEPGEETQIDAFNLVDKLVWLDTVCMPDDIEKTSPPQDSSIKDHAGAKGRQSLAQAAQRKTVRDKLDVFDWEDSQVDNTDTQQKDTKKVFSNVRSRKRQSESYKLLTGRKKQEACKTMTARKKQTSTDRKNTEIAANMKSRDDANVASAAEGTITPNVGKTQKPSDETSFVTTRLRDGSKAQPRRSSRGKQSSRRRVSKEEKIQEPLKGFEAGPQKGTDNAKVEVQQAAVPYVNREIRKRAGRKKSVDKSDEGAQVEQPKGCDRIGTELPRADSAPGKGKKYLLKASKGGLEVRGNLGPVADRTSQDDAMADIWIEAFASKPPPAPATEIVTFRKRRALHEDTGQDSKKRRTEAATLPMDEEHEDTGQDSTKHRTTEAEILPMDKAHQDTSAKEGGLLKEDRIKPNSHIQKDFEKSEDKDATKVSPDKSARPPSLKERRIKPKARIQQAFKKSEATGAAKIPPRQGNRVRARLSQGENQDVKENVNNRAVQQLLIRPADMQLKPRRISTRKQGEGEHRDVSKGEKILMKEDMAEGGLKGQKQYRSAAVVISTPVTSKGGTKRGGDAEHMKCNDGMIDDKLERGPKLRFKAQDAQVLSAGSDTRKGKGAEDAVLKSSTTQATTRDTDGHSLSITEKQNDVEVEREGLLSNQQPITKTNQDAQGNEGATVGPKTRKRIRDADMIALKSAKARKNSTSQKKGGDQDETVPKMEEIDGSKKGDESNPIVGRITRRSIYDGGSQKSEFAYRKKYRVQSHGGESATTEQAQKAHGVANKGLEKEVVTGSPKSLPRHKKTSSENIMSEKLSTSHGGRRRKREPGCIRVLFSHSLAEDIIKHQKKILAKLGGQVVTSALDCTHFVSNGFVRTQNMLVSMAAGKIIATPQWLESCGQAHYFVDAKKHILQDERKEREYGFSMTTSLAAAEHSPLLKGKQVLVCPNTVPEGAVLQSIIESAGGQVMDLKSSSLLVDSKDSDTPLIIIGNEKEVDFCLQFLDKGLKVYSEELLLQGIVTQTLDLSRNRLFKDFKQQNSLSRLASIKA